MLENRIYGTEPAVFINAQTLKNILKLTKFKHKIPKEYALDMYIPDNFFTNAMKHEFVHGRLDQGDIWLKTMLKASDEKRIDFNQYALSHPYKDIVMESIACSLANIGGHIPKLIEGSARSVTKMAEDIGWDQVYRLYVGSTPSDINRILSGY